MQIEIRADGAHIGLYADVLVKDKTLIEPAKNAQGCGQGISLYGRRNIGQYANKDISARTVAKYLKSIV